MDSKKSRLELGLPPWDRSGQQRRSYTVLLRRRAREDSCSREHHQSADHPFIRQEGLPLSSNPMPSLETNGRLPLRIHVQRKDVRPGVVAYHV